MKALTWRAKHDIRCERVPGPEIRDGRDAIIKVTACVIRGSDLHLFDGVMPDMHSGDIMGHETMGGPELYKTFRDKKDGCIKVVMKP